MTRDAALSTLRERVRRLEVWKAFAMHVQHDCSRCGLDPSDGGKPLPSLRCPIGKRIAREVEGK